MAHGPQSDLAPPALRATAGDTPGLLVGTYSSDGTYWPGWQPAYPVPAVPSYPLYPPFQIVTVPIPTPASLDETIKLLAEAVAGRKALEAENADLRTRVEKLEATLAALAAALGG